VRNLLDHGWTVVVADRGRRPPPPELIEAGARIAILDREQPGELARALAGGAVALIDTIAFTQLRADQLLDMQRSVGAFVVILSASVYRDEAGRTLDEARQNRTAFQKCPTPRKVALERSFWIER
jgi:hypothetical protein